MHDHSRNSWFRRSTYGLKRRIAFLFGCFLAIVLAGTVLLSLVTQKGLVEKHLDDRIAIYSEILGNVAQTYLPDLRIDQLSLVVDDLRELPDIDYAQIVDTDGLVLTAGDRADVQQFLTVVDDPAISAATTSGSSSSRTDAGIRHVVVPVFVGGNVDTVLRMGIALGPHMEEMSFVASRSLVFGLMFFAVGLILSNRIASFVVKPITALTRTVRRISNGDLDVEIAVSSNDETQRLASAFRTMLDTLSQSIYRANRLAYVDGLTSLSNREWFLRRLEEAMEADSRLAVFFIDIDNFKRVNDRFGHIAGDELLGIVSERIAEAIASEGFAIDDRQMPFDIWWTPNSNAAIARLGGDEFTVILRDVDEARCNAAASAILEWTTQPLSLEGEVIDTSVSIGWVMYPDHGAEASDLLKHADVAMYESKRQGRNIANMFDATDLSRLLAAEALESEFKVALEAADFDVHFQPQVRAEDGGIVGAEALVRWKNKDGKPVPPPVFIAIAERVGLINDLGLLIMKKALAHAAQWPDTPDGPLRLAVNMSPHEISDHEHILDVLHTVEASGFDPNRLEIEITESSAMADIDVVCTNLDLLRDCGIGLSIDDFGTGYSNLERLRRLNFDVLKIDKSLVDNIGADATSEALLRAAIATAKALGLQIVAEGIESAEQHSFLALHQCEFLQGYHFSRPLSQADFLDYLASVGIDAEQKRSVA